MGERDPDRSDMVLNPLSHVHCWGEGTRPVDPNEYEVKLGEH